MKNKFGKSLLAMMLAIMLVVGMTPTTFLGVNVEAATTDKIADNSTIYEWKDYFLDLKEKGTEYAGGVWTDKSVFESGDAFDKTLQDIETKTGIETDEDNFLIAMSALATNKEVVGYSTIPTDTMLVLDVSQSMDNARSVPDMIDAANEAIDALLSLNKNNRVGVVLYSGRNQTGAAQTNTGTLLLRLDRYTARTDKNYIRSTGNDDTTVSVASGLRYEGGGNVGNASKNTIGGTYIQNGLNIAMDQFLAAEPIVEDGNIQTGDRRMPIFVLMSDGAPTHATTSYTNIGTSNMGTGAGSTATAGVGFATQLTAAFAKEKTEDHYGTEAMFYTLGLNLSGTTGQAVATSVMNPDQSTNAINQYWDRLFQNGSVSFTAHNTDGNEQSFTISRPGNVQNGYTDMLERDDQNYVDRYFDAGSNDKLQDAFRDIVNEIILQSAYYPTYIESGDHDLGGYVTFSDEIGHFMEVKEMEGILLGDKLFTGETLAKMMAEGEFGNASQFTENGWELVETVSARIGVDESTTITLLQNAWRDKQLYYTSDNDYSNYIGWYESEDGKYISFWSQQDGEAAEQAAAANGAKYITKSYGYYGSNAEEGSIIGSDMMHVVVKVRTEIETGLQTVLFEIPASLVPIITYKITLDADSYEEAQNIKMDVDDDIPIRLLFEVGLKDELNEYNLTEIMEAEEHRHPVEDAQGNPTGEYYFYTNVWGYGSDQSQLRPGQHEVAESVFTPSTVNERYYYTEDTVILVKSGDTYEAYTDAAAPSGDGYFRAYRIFKLTGNGNTAEMDWVIEPIGADTLSYNNGENIARNEDGEWYVKEGSARTVLPSYHIEKNPANGGNTKTLRYSRYAVIQESENIEDYSVYSFQGNNGRLKMAPATGIKLTKQVDDTLKNADNEYTFVIELANKADGTYTLYKDGAESDIEFKDGSATVNLKAGESVIIGDLPAGDYRITETVADNAGYKVNKVTVDNVEEDGIIAEDTIINNKMDSVVFINTEAKDGDLIVRKNVTNNYPDATDKVNAKEFTINVKLTDADGNALAEGTEFAVTRGESGDTIELDSNGSFTVELKHNESITIKDIPEGIKYVVTETDLPEGFYLETASANLTGTIVNNQTSIVTVINNYKPDGVPAAIPIKLKKDIDGRDWETDDKFKFQLEKMNADGTWAAVGGIKTVTSENKQAEFVIPEGSLETVGTHYFRVLEVNADEIPGITNDSAKYFAVVVTETDGDGKLEIESITPYGGVTVGSNNAVTIDFVNTYTTEGEAVVNIPVEKHITNDTNVDVSLAGYVFELYAANAAAGDGPVATVTTNAAGEATFHLEYDFTNEEFEELDNADEIDDNTATITYTLSEKNDGKVNVAYDTSAYVVTVVLTSDAGQLRASMTMTKADEAVETAVFTNTFDIPENAEAEFTLNAKKELNGKTLEEEKFSFQMYQTGADFVITDNSKVIAARNDADGNIAFSDSYDKAGTYYYVAKEIIPGDAVKNDAGKYEYNGVTYDSTEYYVTVTVTYDNETNKLIASETIVKPGTGVIEEEAVVFVNDYDVEPTSIILEGTKELTGRDLVTGDFKFVVLDDAGEVVSTTNTSARANSEGIAIGKFTFPAIKYTDPGTYNYTVKEVVPEDAEKLNGMTYDTTVYTVVVTVVDNGDGKMTATPVINDGNAENIVFRNDYKPAPTVLDFSARKQLENMDLEEGQFRFGVYEANSSFAITNETPVVTAVNAADGTVDFGEIPVDKTGTYHYVMKEIIPEGNDKILDVVYDEVEYHITAIVWDMNGKLTARVTYTANGLPANHMTFSNVYFEPTPAEVTLDVTKNLEGRSLIDKEFEFELYQADENYVIMDSLEPIKAKNDSEGNVEFDLNYDVEDMEGLGEKDFYYVIKEYIPTSEDNKGLEYDDSWFKVKISVYNDVEGALIAKEPEITEVDGPDADTAVNGKAEFNNTYEADPAKLTLGGTKTLENKTLKENDFTFAIFVADENYNKVGDAVDTVQNDANGDFVFEDITYHSANVGNTYYYVVEEIAGSDGKVAYDDTVYGIEVTVSDNREGEIVLDIKYDDSKVITQSNVANINTLNFTNGYDPDDAVLNLSGEKLMEGRDIIAGEFTFELYKTDSDYRIKKDAEPVQTKVNDENNMFAFDSIVCGTLGNGEETTSYYVVKEYAPEDKKGVTYDEREYRIEVVVKNTGDGKITQIVTLDGEPCEVGENNTVVIDSPEFVNHYKAEWSADFTIEGQKNLFGDRTEVKKNEFTFILSEVTEEADGNKVMEPLGKAKNDADGKFTFDVAKLAGKYTEPGTYFYSITEETGNENGMKYDETVYEISVEVIDDGEGNLIVGNVGYSVNGNVTDDVTFNNNYDEPSGETKTGDPSNMLPLMALATLAMIGAVGSVLFRRKKA